MEPAAKKAKADNSLSYEELKKAKEEAEEKAQREKRGREEEERRRKEAEEKAQREKRGREEEERRRKEAEEKAKGTYYSRFTQVWPVENKIYQRSDMEQVRFSDLRRASAPQCNDLFYTQTLDKANDLQNVVANNPGSSRTSYAAAATKDKIWPCDIFGPSQDESSLHGDIAHLVPASPPHASLYFDVAKWVFGLPNNEKRSELIQKLIHGSKPGGDDSKRHTHTGLKHLACNKIRLGGQRDFFDTHPAVLIVPIMKLDEMKAWNGEEYNAIVMIDRNDKMRKSISIIASSIGMTEKKVVEAQASGAEVELARFVLETTLKLLAKSLLEGETSELAFLTEEQKELWGTYRRNVIDEEGSSCIKLPKANQDDKALVRKISFVKQGDYSGHPAPDPILLAVKAAVNWSKFHNQQLLAAGEVDEDDERSERSLFAEEQYVQHADWIRRQEPMPIQTIYIPRAAS